MKKKKHHIRIVWYLPFVGEGLKPSEVEQYYYFAESAGYTLDKITQLNPKGLYRDRITGFTQEGLNRFKTQVQQKPIKNINKEAILSTFPDEGNGYVSFAEISKMVKKEKENE